LLPTYVQNTLIRSVVARPLHGEPPTIDLGMGITGSNTSSLLKKFLLRADEPVSHGPRTQRSSLRKKSTTSGGGRRTGTVIEVGK
jgi:LysR family hca operon transcriptional activator